MGKYIKPELEIVKFSTENVALNDIISGEGSGDAPED